MTKWIKEGLHYVASEGRRCHIETFDRGDGTWTAVVKGHFSTYGVTRGNAIRNACAPVNHAEAQASLDEYLAHRRGEISDDDYIASIRARHQSNLKAFRADARAHGEL